MDYERVSAEFLRALRGGRSQTAFARRLGYRSNVIYTWESGRGWPTAAKTFSAARRIGVDPREAIARFYRTTPDWLSRWDPATPSGVARLLTDLKGRMSVQELAERVDRSRFAVSRWLKGTAQPPLPDFFALVEASSMRLLDFIAAFVSPAELSSVAELWRDLEANRAAAYQAPWSQAVLRALELVDYAALAAHRRGWIARRIGITEEEEVACLELLEKSGQILWDGARWVIQRILTVDTRGDPVVTRRLREWWSEVGMDRLRSGADGTFSYNVCGVSAADYERIRGLYRAFFLEMQSVVARSEPVERVVLVNAQIFGLDTIETPQRR